MKPYIINTFRGGVSDENDKGVTGSFKYGHALDIHAKDDALACKYAMLNSITGLNDLVKYFVPASDGSLYAFGSAGSIYAYSEDSGWNTAYNDENGDIRGAAEWGVDGEKTYIYWATSTSLARKELGGTGVVPWTDAVQDHKTTLDDYANHTMGIGSGLLNIANGNFLATVDYNETFNPGTLNIRPGNIIKCLEERDDYLILGSLKLDQAEEGHIWTWISSANKWIQKKRIPVKGVNALITAEMMLLQGGDDGELFYSDFVNAIPLHGIPGGGASRPGAVTIDEDLAHFGIAGGTDCLYPGIWSYGRKRKNRPFALNYAYRLKATVDGSTVTDIGAICNYNGNIFASWQTTDESTIEYGIDQVSTTTRASATFESLEFTGRAPHIKKPFNTVKLVMSPLPSGCSVGVQFKTDKETSWQDAKMGDGTTTFSTAGETEAVFTVGETGRIYEVKVNLTPSGTDTPEIHAVVTYMDETGFEYA